tara:strand:- start:719 stop:940 length:222 start_codon:yes stop_codon:yes gene_type:complete
MKAYSTGSGSVMFIPDTIDRKEEVAAPASAAEPPKNTLMAKTPMSYRSLAGAPSRVHVPLADSLAQSMQQKQA